MKSLGGASSGESLGALLKRARLAARISFGQLSATTGIARSRLHRLENDQVKKVNPADLSILAESLDLSLHQVFQAAGYPTQSALPNLGNELEAKLCELPPEALDRLDAYVDQLVREHGVTLEPGD